MDTFCFAILYFTQCRLCLPLIIEEILPCLLPLSRFLLESRDYGRITKGESCTGESCFKNPGLYTALKSAVTHTYSLYHVHYVSHSILFEQLPVWDGVRSKDKNAMFSTQHFSYRVFRILKPGLEYYENLLLSLKMDKYWREYNHWIGARQCNVLNSKSFLMKCSDSVIQSQKSTLKIFLSM